MEDQGWTVQEAIHISSSARAALDLLYGRGHFSNLGDRIAEGLHATLDTLDNSLALHLRRGIRAHVYGLYVIIDPQVIAGRDPLKIAQETLAGGTKVLQLRDKLRDKGESLALARSIKKLCDEKGSLFIINDHADLAVTIEAHGLHVGQGDLPTQQARQVLRPQQLVGRSNHLVEEALQSEREGADYVAVGSIYPSITKESSRVAGLKPLQRVKELIQVPVVAIGGVSEERIEEVVRAGADAICVTSAVGLAPSPLEATRRLTDKIRRAGGKV